MPMTMAANWRMTRSRMSCCERDGEPPRIMLTSPASSTIATAATANGAIYSSRFERMARPAGSEYRLLI